MARSLSLGNLVHDLGLFDPGFQGDPFTWTNRRMGAACIRERLDRALCSQNWQDRFPETLVKHFTDQGSDHRALLLSDKPYTRHSRPLFRFDARWADNPQVRAMVAYVWQENIEGTPMFRLWERLKKLRHLLYDWSRAGTTNSLRNIRTLQAEIERIKAIIPVNWEVVRDLEVELNRQWEAEEVYWQQKSRVHWLKKGDKNTSYFHTVTRTRRKKNFVERLQNDDGEWIADEKGKAEVATDFYRHLFTSENTVHNMRERVAALPIAQNVTPAMNNALTAVVLPEEVRKTVFAMGSKQAPGSDGFTGKFFKAFWDIVGPSVIDAVCSFFTTGKMLRGFNHTWLTLIPKVDTVESMRQLRPISLCQFVYKIITKILAERLACVLPKIVSEGQNAFIRERQIVENILLGHELMHYLKTKKRGKKGYMALKVDMEKAYDRVEWTFLLTILEKLGFSSVWVGWIQECLRSASFLVMMNGTPSVYFTASRGLRQGDPLSPLLFVLCTEGFATLLRKAISEKKLAGTKVAPRAPRISHLFFADDSYLFLRGTVTECENLMAVLNKYEELSGQRVNLAKSAVCFSHNITIPDQELLATIMGVGAVGVHDKYLGLPSLVARSKMETFRYLEEKLLARLQGWKQKTLSWAAKETLIKSVAMALPLHVMSCFKLPLSLCRLLDKHVARFWWGCSEDHSKVQWVSWRDMCRSKHDGGMGFRHFELFNQALLAKIGWRILCEPQSLLAQVYKGKYFPQGNFLSATARSRPSWGWQSILFGRRLLEMGLRWHIGNGRSASMLFSTWVPQNQFEPLRYNPGVLPTGGDPTVAELICPGEGRWCDHALSQWFDPATCRNIKAIPLPRANMEDRLIWYGTADGVFSVKSAYHLAVALEQRRGRRKARVDLMDRTRWIRLWEANIPPKLKVFVWQIFRRIIPTTEALIERKVQVHPRCPVCWEATETPEHLFLDCPVARALWGAAGLEHIGEGLPRHTFPLFLKRVMALVHQPDLFMAIVAILWRIWRSRNWVVFEGKQYRVDALMRQFSQQFEEWVRLPVDKPVWGPAGAGVHLAAQVDSPAVVICGWDEATRRGSHSAGGVVLMTPNRDILMATGMQFPVIDDPLVVELLVLREAVLWCLSRGLLSVRFEGDSKVVIDKIQAADTRDSRLGAVLAEVLYYFTCNPGFSVRFIGRGNNRVAHLVARKALSLYPNMNRSYDFQTWLLSRV
ncbi:unnamed protein product [Linum trigynum]|uniref:Reverse transcriptase domain-containing protein n=1 Tax=Linum trigynum TaxID=586398 RepID=A0AAV2DZ38_9ROSI